MLIEKQMLYCYQSTVSYIKKWNSNGNLYNTIAILKTYKT